MTESYHIHSRIMDRLGSPDNLRTIWSIVTIDDIESGTVWYAVANSEAKRLSAKYNLSLDVSARVIAVLSPVCEWGENVKAAEHVICAYQSGQSFPPFVAVGVKALAKSWDFTIPFSCYPINILKAFWILSGHPEALHGPKVEDFHRNIVNCTESVTVDSHYVMAWLGLLYPGTYGFDERYHAIVTADTETVAGEVGVTPAAFQAIIWKAKKRIQSGSAGEAVKIMDAVRRAA